MTTTGTSAIDDQYEAACRETQQLLFMGILLRGVVPHDFARTPWAMAAVERFRAAVDEGRAQLCSHLSNSPAPTLIPAGNPEWANCLDCMQRLLRESSPAAEKCACGHVQEFTCDGCGRVIIDHSHTGVSVRDTLLVSAELCCACNGGCSRR
jgi:hypothetical protein